MTDVSELSEESEATDVFEVTKVFVPTDASDVLNVLCSLSPNSVGEEDGIRPDEGAHWSFGRDAVATGCVLGRCDPSSVGFADTFSRKGRRETRGELIECLALARA